MIRQLSDSEMEEAAGGFSFEGQARNIEYAPSLSNLALVATQTVSLSSLVGMAPPDPQPRAENATDITSQLPDLQDISRYICRNRRGRYELCTEDGVNERWESYRPQQPSFRSRFINR